MIEAITIARPYAKALFELAQEQKNVDEWLDILSDLSSVVTDGRMRILMYRPRSFMAVKEVFSHVLGKRYPGMVENFLTLLHKNHRLALLPKIVEAFSLFKDAAQGILNARVETAFLLTDSQQQKLITTLSNHTQKTIQLTQCHCPELIGGIRIMIQNNIIDQSIRGLLKTMAIQLNHEG